MMTLICLAFRLSQTLQIFLKIPSLASKDTWEQSEQKEILSDVIVILTHSLRIKHQSCVDILGI